MYKKILALMCAAVLIILPAGCVGADSADSSIIVGHTQFDSAVNNAVVLSDNAADIILQIGYESRIVGKSDECTQQQLEAVESFGSKAQPEVNKIISESPNVVIADSDLSADIANQLEEAGVPVLRFVQPSDESELLVMYKKLNLLFEGNQSGELSGENSYNELIAAIEDNSKSLPDISRPKTVCYLADFEGTTITGDMMGNLVFTSSGAENIAASMSGGKADISYIKEQNPQYIFCDSGLAEMVKTNTDLKDLLAVKNNRVVEIPYSSFTRGGVSLLDAISVVTETLYPDGEAGSVAENYGIEYDEDIYLTVGNGADTEDNDVDGYRNTIIIIQTRLDDLGYWPIDEMTGYYGETTASAVSEFQSTNGLENTSGSADFETLNKMFSDDAVARSEPIEKQPLE